MEWPAAVQEVFRKALASDPATRHGDAIGFAKDLDTAMADFPFTSEDQEYVKALSHRSATPTRSFGAVDPTTADREFCDTGRQYRTGIFVHDAEQRRLAEESKRGIERTKTFAEPILTTIEAAGPFYPAEDYHQDFYKKSPIRYYSYRAGCGRDRRLEELWGGQAGH